MAYPGYDPNWLDNNGQTPRQSIRSIMEDGVRLTPAQILTDMTQEALARAIVECDRTPEAFAALGPPLYGLIPPVSGSLLPHSRANASVSSNGSLYPTDNGPLNGSSRFGTPWDNNDPSHRNYPQSAQPDLPERTRDTPRGDMVERGASNFPRRRNRSTDDSRNGTFVGAESGLGTNGACGNGDQASSASSRDLTALLDPKYQHWSALDDQLSSKGNSLSSKSSSTHVSSSRDRRNGSSVPKNVQPDDSIRGKEPPKVEKGLPQIPKGPWDNACESNEALVRGDSLWAKLAYAGAEYDVWNNQSKIQDDPPSTSSSKESDSSASSLPGSNDSPAQPLINSGRDPVNVFPPPPNAPPLTVEARSSTNTSWTAPAQPSGSITSIPTPPAMGGFSQSAQNWIRNQTSTIALAEGRARPSSEWETTADCLGISESFQQLVIEEQSKAIRQGALDEKLRIERAVREAKRTLAPQPIGPPRQLRPELSLKPPVPPPFYQPGQLNGPPGYGTRGAAPNFNGPVPTTFQNLSMPQGWGRSTAPPRPPPPASRPSFAPSQHLVANLSQPPPRPPIQKQSYASPPQANPTRPTNTYRKQSQGNIDISATRCEELERRVSRIEADFMKRMSENLANPKPDRPPEGQAEPQATKEATSEKPKASQPQSEPVSESATGKSDPVPQEKGEEVEAPKLPEKRVLADEVVVERSKEASAKSKQLKQIRTLLEDLLKIADNYQLAFKFSRNELVPKAVLELVAIIQYLNHLREPFLHLGTSEVVREYQTKVQSIPKEVKTCLNVLKEYYKTDQSTKSRSKSPYLGTYFGLRLRLPELDIAVCPKCHNCHEDTAEDVAQLCCMDDMTTFKLGRMLFQ